MAPRWRRPWPVPDGPYVLGSAGGVQFVGRVVVGAQNGVMGAVHAQWSALSLALVTNLVLFWVCERDPRCLNPEAGGVS